MKTRSLYSAFLLLGFLLLVPLSGAEMKYLKPGSPDGLTLLPPPPSIDSREQMVDMTAAKAAYDSRTPEEVATAKSETELSIFSFAPVVGAWFQPGKFPKTEALFKQVEKDTKAVTNVVKDHWKRQRPYALDKHFEPVEIEKSFSYPSGHSTRGTVFAALLAEIFPEKKEELLKMGRGMGFHRVVGGVHFPTDIFAGRVLGQAIATEMLKSDAFKKDLAEARAEIETSKPKP